jgi:thiosulfate dehydrogenase [quinone] large subunit
MKDSMKQCSSMAGKFLSKALIIRLALGGMLFLYGVAKFKAGVAGFADNMSAPFGETIIPLVLAKGFLFAVPYLEVILGGLLILGLFTEVAARLSALLFALFIIGLTALNGPNNIIAMAANFIYITAAFKLICCSHSILSLDHVICGKNCESCKA